MYFFFFFFLYDTLPTYSPPHGNYNCAPASSYSLATKQLSFAEGLEVEGVSGSTKEDFTLHS